MPSLKQGLWCQENHGGELGHTPPLEGDLSQGPVMHQCFLKAAPPRMNFCPTEARGCSPALLHFARDSGVAEVFLATVDSGKRTGRPACWLCPLLGKSS